MQSHCSPCHQGGHLSSTLAFTLPTGVTHSLTQGPQTRARPGSRHQGKAASAQGGQFLPRWD